jgi:hypothetical protein
MIIWKLAYYCVTEEIPFSYNMQKWDKYERWVVKHVNERNDGFFKSAILEDRGRVTKKKDNDSPSRDANKEPSKHESGNW